MNPVISAILLISFSIIITGFAFKIGMPLTEKHLSEIQFENGKQVVNYISYYIVDIEDDPVNSSKMIKIPKFSGIIYFSDNNLIYTTGFKTINRSYNSEFNNYTIFGGDQVIKIKKTGKNRINISD